MTVVIFLHKESYEWEQIVFGFHDFHDFHLLDSWLFWCILIQTNNSYLSLMNQEHTVQPATLRPFFVCLFVLFQ